MKESNNIRCHCSAVIISEPVFPRSCIEQIIIGVHRELLRLSAIHLAPPEAQKALQFVARASIIFFQSLEVGKSWFWSSTDGLWNLGISPIQYKFSLVREIHLCCCQAFTRETWKMKTVQYGVFHSSFTTLKLLISSWHSRLLYLFIYMSPQFKSIKLVTSWYTVVCGSTDMKGIHRQCVWLLRLFRWA